MFIFRVDGNSEIGIGHIMRCLSIADATKSVCLFMIADDKPASYILEHGHQVAILKSDYRQLEKELEKYNSILDRYPHSVLIVDSYFVTQEYLKTVKEISDRHSCILAYIDDIIKFAYSCDVLINYNIYGLDYEGKYDQLYNVEKMMKPCFLLGSLYAPLRAEFHNRSIRKMRHEAKCIMVSTGGSDPNHITKSIINYIFDNYAVMSQYEFYIIVGVMNEDKDDIMQMTTEKTNIHILYNVANMQEIMNKCDIAVSAAGSTLYELCATQTPTVTYILEDNQIPGAEGFKHYGVMECVGDVRQLGVGCLVENLLKEAVQLADNYDERCRIAKLQHTIVDGDGATRIVKKLVLLNKQLKNCKL